MRFKIYFPQVTATDEDTENFGSVSYNIHDSASNPSVDIPFSINSVTGSLKTNREIKYGRI